MNIFFRKRRPQISVLGEAGNPVENKGGVPRQVMKDFARQMMRSMRKAPKEEFEGLRVDFFFTPETIESAKEIADYLTLTAYEVVTHVKEDDSLVVSASSTDVKIEEVSLLAAIDEMFNCAAAADVQFRNMSIVPASLPVSSGRFGR